MIYGNCGWDATKISKGNELLFRDGNKLQNRVNVAEDFREFARIVRPNGGSRRELLSDNPRLQLGPVFVPWPTRILFPVALDRGIPVTFVFESEPSLLLHKPSGIFSDSRLGNEGKHGLLAF